MAAGWLAGAAGIAGPAAAAPQLLALLDARAPVPLNCRGTDCSAELPAMCLQPERRAPEVGRAYRAVQGGAIRVLGTDRRGRERALAMPPDTTFTTLRTHVAVRIDLPRPWLSRHFAEVKGLIIDGPAVLRPRAAAFDHRPLREAEVAAVQGRAAAVAHRVFAGDAGSVATARISNFLINVLPNGDRVSDANLGAAWRRAVAALPAERRRDLSTARFVVDYCQYSAGAGLARNLHTCLRARQDQALEDLHQTYVNALNTGS
jgi:hypothetical protein